MEECIEAKNTSGNNNSKHQAVKTNTQTQPQASSSNPDSVLVDNEQAGSYVQFLTSDTQTDVIALRNEPAKFSTPQMKLDTAIKEEEDEEEEGEDETPSPHNTIRRERRRFTNRKAAQKSREKEKNKEANLIKESLEQESRMTTLKYEIRTLQGQKKDLERILEAHRSKCEMLPSSGSAGISVGNESFAQDNSVIISQTSDGSAISSTPSPNPLQMPFASYNTGLDTKAALDIILKRTHSSPAAPFPADQYLASESSVLPCPPVHPKLIPSTPLLSPPIQAPVFLDTLLSSVPSVISNAKPTHTATNEHAHPKQSHTFIPLDKFKELAMKIAIERKGTIDMGDRDVEPATKKARVDSNMNVTTHEKSTPSQTLTLSDTVVNVIAHGHEHNSNNPSQNSISVDALGGQAQETYTYIASEIDPSLLKQQDINVIYMEEVPEIQNGNFEPNMGNAVVRMDSVPCSSENTNTFSDPNTSFSVATNATPELQSPDSIAVSALLELNRGIVDSSASG